MIKNIFLLSVILLSVFTASAGQVYITAETGNDANSGTKIQPLRMLAEAARKRNMVKVIKSIEIAGIFTLFRLELFSSMSESLRLRRGFNL